jgi:hypothetical protein
MSDGWPVNIFKSVPEILEVLNEWAGKGWLCRGQSKRYDGLLPSIDRGELRNFSRQEKLRMERRSIDLFKSTARSFAPGEEGAMRDDIVALMILQHYGAPTRLLDWTASPWVATYFAVCDHKRKNGEIWGFDYKSYVEKGREQWKIIKETTIDGSGDPDKFDAKLTAFSVEEPQNWIVCAFYPSGFSRQDAQNGAYSLTPCFNIDHATKMAEMLENPNNYQRYVIRSKFKSELLEILREEHGIWRGSLFPDSAGAAQYVKESDFGRNNQEAHILVG